MLPAQSIFQEKLALYKEQKMAEAKDLSVLSRLSKSKAKDFKQQRGTDFTKVKNIAAKATDIGGGDSMELQGYGQTQKSTGKLMYTAGRNVQGKFEPLSHYSNKPQQTIVKAGKLKVLSMGRRWTTAGYQSFGVAPSTEPAKPPEKKTKPISLSEALLKPRMFGKQVAGVYESDLFGSQMKEKNG